jgi:hypothetical protein
MAGIENKIDEDALEIVLTARGTSTTELNVSDNGHPRRDRALHRCQRLQDTGIHVRAAMLSRPSNDPQQVRCHASCCVKRVAHILDVPKRGMVLVQNTQRCRARKRPAVEEVIYIVDHLKRVVFRTTVHRPGCAPPQVPRSEICASDSRFLRGSDWLLSL